MLAERSILDRLLQMNRVMIGKQTHVNSIMDYYQLSPKPLPITLWPGQKLPLIWGSGLLQVLVLKALLPALQLLLTSSEQLVHSPHADQIPSTEMPKHILSTNEYFSFIWNHDWCKNTKSNYMSITDCFATLHENFAWKYFANNCAVEDGTIVTTWSMAAQTLSVDTYPRMSIGLLSNSPFTINWITVYIPIVMGILVDPTTKLALESMPFTNSAISTDS